MRKTEKLGQILLREGIIDQLQLQSAQSRQRQFGGKILTNCLILGFLSEETSLRVLSYKLDMPAINISGSVFSLKAIDAIPKKLIKQYSVLPVKVTEDQLFVALTDYNIEALDAIRFSTSLKVVPYVTLEITINENIERVFDFISKNKSYFYGVSINPFEDEISTESLIIYDCRDNLVITDKKNISKEEFTVSEGTVFDAVDRSEDFFLNENKLERNPKNETEEKEELIGLTNRPRIVLVDNMKSPLQLTNAIINNSHYHIETTDVAEKCYQILNENEPDIIIVNITCPEIEGLNLIKEIRARGYIGLPLIAVSNQPKGWRFKIDLFEFFQPDMYVDYYINPSDIKQLIGEILNKSGNSIDEERLENKRYADHAIKVGVQKYKEGDHRGAIEIFDEAIKRDSLSGKAHFYKANVLYRQKKVHAAIIEYETSLRLSPDYFPALKNLALLYEKIGFKRTAFGIWQKSLSLSPDNTTKLKVQKRINELSP